ncbi:MAG: hypothetical protein HC827_09905 [Cyanobacteria bacterium RM1_2_2]|nr:hypothetical protein [Cyanobacteria bacterium RM1_2_2]
MNSYALFKNCLNQDCQMGWLPDPEERSLLIHSTAQPPDFLQAEQAP